MSFKPEVFLQSGGWLCDGLRFATKAEASASALDLYRSWPETLASRATESNDPVNFSYINGQLKSMKSGGLF